MGLSCVWGQERGQRALLAQPDRPVSVWASRILHQVILGRDVLSLLKGKSADICGIRLQGRGNCTVPNV